MTVIKARHSISQAREFTRMDTLDDLIEDAKTRSQENADQELNEERSQDSGQHSDRAKAYKETSNEALEDSEEEIRPKKNVAATEKTKVKPAPAPLNIMVDSGNDNEAPSILEEKKGSPITAKKRKQTEKEADRIAAEKLMEQIRRANPREEHLSAGCIDFEIVNCTLFWLAWWAIAVTLLYLKITTETVTSGIDGVNATQPV